MRPVVQSVRLTDQVSSQSLSSLLSCLTPLAFHSGSYTLRQLFCNVSRNPGSARPCQTSAMGVRVGRSIAIEMKEGSPNMSSLFAFFFSIFLFNHFPYFLFFLFLPFLLLIDIYSFFLLLSLLSIDPFILPIFLLRGLFSWKDICQSSERLAIHPSVERNEEIGSSVTAAQSISVSSTTGSRQILASTQTQAEVEQGSCQPRLT